MEKNNNVAHSETKEEELTIEKTANEKKRRFLGRKIYLFDPENDIKYKGPLSYRYLRIIGWLCFAVAQVGIALKLGTLLNGMDSTPYQTAISITSTFSNIPIFLFLLANLALIMQSKYNFKRSLLKFGALSLAIYAAINIFVYRYAVYGLSKIADVNLHEASVMINEGLTKLGLAFYNLNVFVDLFLFTLMYFFLDYKPKKFFVGKKIYIFRWMILIPILYEAACIVFKYLDSSSIIFVPIYIKTLFPTKSPLMFIAFLVVLLVMKLRERRFLTHGRTHEEYDQFLLSNRNSLHFSIIFMIVLAAMFVVDLVGTLTITIVHITNNVLPDQSNIDVLVNDGFSMAQRLGFMSMGGSLLIIPFMPLFSYQRKHKASLVDIIIPVAGIALTVLVVLETAFQILLSYIG